MFISFSLFIYADDTTPIVSGEVAVRLQEEANALLDELCTWFGSNNLFLNTQKTGLL